MKLCEKLKLDEYSNKPTAGDRFLREAPAIIGDVVQYGTAAVGGFLLGSPEGAAGGILVGNVLARKTTGVLEDLTQRYLSKREEARIGTVLYYANEKYKLNIKNNKTIRSDGFFNDTPGERSSFEEIFEGLLIVAKSDFEEKKLPYYGNLLGNIPFEPGYDKSQANLLIRVLEDLSYRQLCIIALIARIDNFELRDADYRGGEKGSRIELDYKLISLLQEIKKLYSQDLVSMSGNVILSIPAINPKRLVLQGTGGAIHELAELDNLFMKNYSDLKSIAELLSA